MTPPPVPALSETATAVCILSILLVPFAAAGLALVNAGLVRSRSAAHSMLASLCVMAVGAVVYFVCGFAWQGFAGRPAHALTLAGRAWSWIAAEPFFWRGLEFNGSPASLAAWLGALGAGLAALIPLGAGAERWRLGASCASTALLAGWTTQPSTPAADAPAAPAKHAPKGIAHDQCAICTVMQLASAAVPTAGPALPLPLVSSQERLGTSFEFVLAASPHHSFQARAPPKPDIRG